MKFFAAVLALSAVAFAAPAELEKRASPCASLLYSEAQCCSTNVLGLADLDCSQPQGSVSNRDSFNSACGGEGKKAQCCTLPLLGLGVLCTDPLA